MKMKEFEPRGVRVPSAPWIRQSLSNALNIITTNCVQKVEIEIRTFLKEVLTQRIILQNVPKLFKVRLHVTSNPVLVLPPFKFGIVSMMTV